MAHNKKMDKKAEVNFEDILKTMTREGGVRGWIVVNWEGIPVKYQGYTDSEAVSYAGAVMGLVDKTDSFLDEEFVHGIIPSSTTEISTIQLRTPKHELIIAPHPKFILICVYDPSYVEPEKEGGEDEDDFI